MTSRELKDYDDFGARLELFLELLNVRHAPLNEAELSFYNKWCVIFTLVQPQEKVA